MRLRLTVIVHVGDDRVAHDTLRAMLDAAREHLRGHSLSEPEGQVDILGPWQPSARAESAAKPGASASRDPGRGHE